MTPRSGESREDFLARCREYQRAWRNRADKPERPVRLGPPIPDALRHEWKRARINEYRRTSPKFKARSAAKREAHRDQIREKARDYARRMYRDPEAQGWRQRRRERNRAYRAAHPEYFRRYQAAYVVPGSIYVNRKTMPPEVVAIAELIYETRQLLTSINRENA